MRAMRKWRLHVRPERLRRLVAKQQRCAVLLLSTALHYLAARGAAGGSLMKGCRSASLGVMRLSGSSCVARQGSGGRLLARHHVCKPHTASTTASQRGGALQAAFPPMDPCPRDPPAAAAPPRPHLHHALQQVDELCQLAAVGALPRQQRPKVLLHGGVGDEAPHLGGAGSGASGDGW